jgi:Fe-S oxidoreductase
VNWVLVLGLVINAIALPIAGRRVVWLYRLITSGQPAPDRIEGVTGRTGRAVRNQLVEVFGQRRLLKWTVPGAAHFFVFWAFVILATVYLEAYGVMLGPDDFAIPLVGHWEVLGFLQDFIAVAALISLGVFAWIRFQQDPEKLGRKSRFKGSHLGGAWLVLFMIFNVIWTMFLFRGAASALGNLPYDSGAFVSVWVGTLLDGLSEDALHVLEGVGLLLHIGVMLVFLVIVLNSKHLHIFLAPLNVMFKRDPVALGAVKPLTSDGKAVSLDDIEEMDEDTTLGIGKVEDFSWKGMLDFATCTECGRCQSQCPAWTTDKPLSPKMLIMNLRDHAFAKAPYLLADEADRERLTGDVMTEVERPLVGETEGEAWHPTGGGVIDPDVLWSCVTCGACVQQCPVDIEHVDHIVDMRRYQVLVESNFPAELNQLFKGMETKGNPWNMSPSMRMDWAQGLDFDVPVVGEDLESLDSVDWLFWVGCAGAYEDRAKKTTRAVAELLNTAGVSFGVLGQGETCTGDSARRAGNEFVFQGLAQQNVETFKEYRVKKVVSTCAHCFNTLKNEYREFGIELEVVHHTQLLNRLVREGRLTPVPTGDGAAKRSITYHDPCYIGRHNQVYEPPRELLTVLPGAEMVEMERNSERSFCCGAGGARMWMEEKIGERINLNRTTEAVGTGADQIAVGCPFCRVMLSDGLTALQDKGHAREEVEVLDVAQMLLASVKGVPATKAKAGAGTATATGAATVVEETRAEPAGGDTTATGETLTETADVGPAAKASGGGSLFDVGGDEPAATATEAKPVPEEAAAAEPASAGGSLFDVESEEPASGGSLFDVESEEPATSGSLFDVGGEEPATGGSLFDVGADDSSVDAGGPAPAESGAVTTQDRPGPAPAGEIPEGTSLFDIAAPAEPTPPAAAPAPEPETEAVEPVADTAATGADAEPPPSPAAPATPVASEIPEGGSLFDLEAPEPSAPAQTEGQPEPHPEPAAPAEPVAPEDSAGSAGATDEDAAPAGAGGDDSPEPASSDDEGGARSKPDGHQPRTDADIGGAGSLFDL